MTRYERIKRGAEVLKSWGKSMGEPPLAATTGSVWLVMWHSQDSRASGVSAVFESEADAKEYADKSNQSTSRCVYTPQLWPVTPNA